MKMRTKIIGVMQLDLPVSHSQDQFEGAIAQDSLVVQDHFEGVIAQDSLVAHDQFQGAIVEELHDQRSVQGSYPKGT